MDAVRAYLAAPDFEAELARELGDSVIASLNGLFLTSADCSSPAWAANTWHNPQRIAITSIGDGARQLRAIQRNWTLHPGNNFRRSRLIAEQLPPVSAKPIAFGETPPDSPLGSWTLIDPNTILAASRCSSPVPHGAYTFIEDRDGPPSRAYLKLWEALTRIGHKPSPGETCLDLGASPGGWTWVLASLGADVISVDKAPLAPGIAAHPNVRMIIDSAFALSPSRFPSVDWIFSDVICYPARLLRLANHWLAHMPQARFLFTIKFQGETDFSIINSFKMIPRSNLLHLHHNKHELTWYRI